MPDFETAMSILGGAASGTAAPMPTAAPTSGDDPFARKMSILSQGASGSLKAPAMSHAPGMTAGDVAADVAKSAASGLAKGAIATATAPHDMPHLIAQGLEWGLNKLIPDQGGFMPEGQARFLAALREPALKQKGYQQGPDYLAPKVQSAIEKVTGPFHEAQTVPGQYAETVASFLPGVAAVGGAGGAFARMRQAAAASVLPGVASETAGQVTKGTEYEPAARLAGAVAGGIAPIVGAPVAEAARAAAAHMPPLTEAGRTAAAERMVAQEIAQAGGGAPAVKSALAQNPDFVPGSQGTLAQRALTPELAQWEDAIRINNRAAFNERAAEQNAKRVEHLAGMQPLGNPQELVGGLQAQRMAAAQQGQAAVESAQRASQAQQEAAQAWGGAGVAQAQAEHASALDALKNPPTTGAPQDTAAYFRSIRDALHSDAEAAVARAQSAAESAKAAAMPTAQSIEEAGGALRGPAADALAARKAADNALYEAARIPDNATVPSFGVKAKADEIAKSLTPENRAPTGEEARLFDLAKSYGDQISFNRLKSLRSSILDEMANLRRENPQAYRRLDMLRGSVEDAMDHAVENQAALDDIAVARGAKNPADTVLARINQKRDEFSGPNSAVAAGRAGNGNAAGQQAGGVSGLSSAGSGEGRGLGNVASGEGLRAPSTDVGGESGQRVHYPGGSVNVRYEVVDFPDLVTSHRPDFSVRPDYPANLQPRSRESIPSQDQVNNISARLAPERLGASAEANTGAPIIGPDNVVESGNGRSMAIGKAYAEGRGEDYRKWLESQGYDTAGMKQPVLVARRVTPMSDAEREYFAHAANTSTGLRMSAAEQAATDARLLTPDVVAELGRGGVTSAENQGVIRSFLAKLPANERAGFLDKDGQISQQGARRLEAAVSSKAYGDSDFVARAFDSYDPNIKGLAGALTDAAGPWAKMREAAARGEIDVAHDVTPDLMDAVKLVMRARDAGRPLGEVMSQVDMFKGDTPALVRSLLLRDDGALASRATISDRLRAYADEALKNTAGSRLFGEAASPADLLKNAGKKGEEVAPPSASGGATFEQGANERPKVGTPVTEDQIAALRKANASYREQRETYGEGPIADILEKKPRGADFELSNAEVPRKIFHPGDRGGEDVRAYIRAVGPEKAAPVLSDLAAFMLHEKAFANGIPDLKKITTWLDQHKTALAALPSDVRQKFETIASAQKSVDEALAAKRARLDEFDRSAAAKIAGLDHPGDIVQTIGSVLGQKDGAKIMADMVASAKGDESALNGVKQSVVEYILNKFAPEASAPRTAALRDFLASKSDVLAAAGFSPEEIAGLNKRASAVTETAQKAETAKTASVEAVKSAKAQGEAAVKEAQTKAAERLKPFEETALKNLLNAQSHSDILDVVRGLFTGTNPTAKMASLAEAAKGIQGGTEALKKAVSEVIQREFTSTAQTSADAAQLKGAPFQKFVRDKEDVLRAAGLSDEQIGRLSAIVQDQQREAAAFRAAKIAGQSNTAPDAINAAKKRGASILAALTSKELVQAAAGAAGAFEHGITGGIGGYLGAKFLGALREAGLQEVDKLRVAAALDPELALALLEKIPNKPDTGGAAKAALRLRRLAMIGVASAPREQSR